MGLQAKIKRLQLDRRKMNKRLQEKYIYGIRKVNIYNKSKYFLSLTKSIFYFAGMLFFHSI